MINQQEIDSSDPKEQARALLAICPEMRKRIDGFLRMSEEEQQKQNQEEIYIAFSHLVNCRSQDAFIALTGSAQGSGQCNALWKKISTKYDSYTDLVCEHLTRIKYPDLWLKLEEARKKDEMGIKPSVVDRFIGWVFAWMFSPPEKSLANEEEKDGKD